MIALSAVDYAFELRSELTLRYIKIGIYCFSANYAALRQIGPESEKCVSVWNNISTPEFCFRELAL